MADAHRILRIGALGAAAATLLLIALIVIVLPAGNDVSALRGAMTPADFGAAVDRHATNLQAAMAIDNLFVIAYSIALLGIASLVRTRTRLLGNVALGAVLLAALLDYGENSLTLGLIRSYLLDISPRPGWLLVLHVIGQVKYLVAFAAVALLAMGLWSPKRLDRVMSILALLFPLVGVTGLVISTLALLTILWMLALLVCAGLLLWRRTTDP